MGDVPETQMREEASVRERTADLVGPLRSLTLDRWLPKRCEPHPEKCETVDFDRGFSTPDRKT
jgi:hypothetical protein